MESMIDKFLEFFEGVLDDIINGLLQEDGYEEPFWKTVILLLPRCLFALIALPVLAFIFLIEALGIL